MITDEQVFTACEVFYKNERVLGHNLDVAMRKALEVYEASKWVKFDVNDESTYPIVPDGYVNIEVNVYDTVNNNINHDYFHPDYGFNHYQHHVTHWQYLPDYATIK